MAELLDSNAGIRCDQDMSQRASRSHFRNKVRWERRVEVRYCQLGPDAPTTERRAYTSNISLLGAFIVTRELLPKGAKLRLALSLPPDQSELVLEAEVRWVTSGRGSAEPGMGVQFIHPAPEQIERLEDFLSVLTDTIDFDDLG